MTTTAPQTSHRRGNALKATAKVCDTLADVLSDVLESHAQPSWPDQLIPEMEIEIDVAAWVTPAPHGSLGAEECAVPTHVDRDFIECPRRRQDDDHSDNSAWFRARCTHVDFETNTATYLVWGVER